MKRKRIVTTIQCCFLAFATLSLFSACALFWDSSRNNSSVTSQDASKFIKSIRAYQGNAESHYELGCYLQERKKHKAAIEELKGALQIDPNHFRAYNGLGVSYDAVGDYDRAVDSYKAAPKIDEKLDYVLNNLGYSYFLQGRLDLAIESFKRALDLYSGNELYRNNLGLAYAKSGKYTAAFAEFKQTGIEAKAHYNIAQLYYQQGLYKEAEEHFEQASTLKAADPENERGLKAAANLAEITTNSVKDPAKAGDATVRNEEKQTMTASPVLAGNRVREGGSVEATRILEAQALKLYDKEQALELVSLEIPAMRKRPTPEVNIEVSNGNGVNRMARRVGNYLNLTDAQADAIRTAAADVFGDDAEVWLFGSRADDRRRGGDIDLLVRPGLGARDRPFHRRVRFLARLERALGERKIDVVVEAPVDDRPIVAVAHATGVRL